MKSFSIQHQDGIYFCTDVVVNHAYVFTEKRYCDVIVNSWAYCRKNKGLNIHAYVIMPNHVHTVVSARNENLSSVLRDYKRFTSLKITEMLMTENRARLLALFGQAAAVTAQDHVFKVWKPGSHPQLMDGRDKCRQKMEYIHYNPVRKGYVNKPEHWVYSSARNYLLDDDSMFPVDRLG